MGNYKQEAAHREYKQAHDLMSAAEVASFLSLGQDTVYKKAWKEKLGGCLKFRGRTYFRREAVEAFKKEEMRA